MRILYKTIVTMVAAVLLSGLALPVLAERGRDDDSHRRENRVRDNSRRGPEHERYRAMEREHVRDRNWVLDKRHNHNHYYPKRGHVIRELPRSYRVFHHHHERYYFVDGIWYRPSVSGFVVVTPPVGMTVTLLPPFYTTIWVGGIPYYYADGVYYRWRPAERVYVVSEAPAEPEVVEDASIPQQLFVYPKQGQSSEQQNSDRYECHRWSVEQTGFDPTQPGGNVPEEQNVVKRSDYQRAMKACLEARGYSVQ